MECTKVLAEIKGPPPGMLHRYGFSHSQVLAMGPKLVSVSRSHRVKVTCHGLGKYWHSGFCEISLTLCIQAKGKKRKAKNKIKGGGGSTVFLKTNRLKAKEQSLRKLKDHTCWPNADLYAL